jgi:hypothetical protein
MIPIKKLTQVLEERRASLNASEIRKREGETLRLHLS